MSYDRIVTDINNRTRFIDTSSLPNLSVCLSHSEIVPVTGTIFVKPGVRFIPSSKLGLPGIGKKLFFAICDKIGATFEKKLILRASQYSQFFTKQLKTLGKIRAGSTGNPVFVIAEKINTFSRWPDR